MATNTLRPTTVTEYGQQIIQAGNLGWQLYLALKRLGAHGVMALGEYKNDFVNLAAIAGYDDPAQAAEYIQLLGLCAEQLQAETINGQPNAMRMLLHKIG